MALHGIGKKVEILTEVGNGQGGVTTAWTTGTVVGHFSKNQCVPDGRPGIVVNAPGSAYRNKNIQVSDAMQSSVVRSAK